MTDFNILGRPDGLGNRIEEMILISAFCSKEKKTATYIWNNKNNNRSYSVHLTSPNIVISEKSDENILYKTLPELKLNTKLFDQEDLLKSAKNIIPTFNIHFKNGIKPVGVHIRGTDRINNNINHPHYMKNEKEFFSYLSKTSELINLKCPKYIFICSDDIVIREIFIKNLRKDITVINPTHDANIAEEYIDFFALSLCEEIYMSSKFSSFAIIASMVGNIPLITFSIDKYFRAILKYESSVSNNENFYLENIHNYRFKSRINKIKRLLTRFWRNNR
jgi:hypothetical protein